MSYAPIVNVLMSENKMFQQRIKLKLSLSVVVKLWMFKAINCLTSKLCSLQLTDLKDFQYGLLLRLVPMASEKVPVPNTMTFDDSCGRNGSFPWRSLETGFIGFFYLFRV